MEEQEANGYAEGVKVEVLGEEHMAINEGRKHKGRSMKNFGKVKGWCAVADTGAQSHTT